MHKGGDMSFDGTYQVTVKTPMGNQEGKLTIQTTGDGFSGSLETPSGASDFSGGRISGSRRQWQAETKTPMGAFDVSYSATIEGDTLSGTAATPLGEAPMEGKKI
jgi:hypothetical protein